MIIKDFKIKKKDYVLDVHNLSFDKVGVYKIEGSNGSGKTTLLETIFRNPQNITGIETSIKTSVAYLPQENFSYKVLVKDFLETDDNKALTYYLDLFKVDYLNKDVRDLSGGQYNKIRIIRAFLKNTPYIFLDEPTNNLDNDSVIVLEDLIKEKMITRTIVVITHDSRLNLEYDGIYNIGNGSVNCTKENLKSSNIFKYSKIMNIKRLKIKDYVVSLFNLFFLLLLISFGLNSANLLYSKMVDDVYMDTIQENDSFIDLINVSENCPAFTALKFTKDDMFTKCDTFKLLDTSNLIELSQDNNVQDVFVFDEVYQDYSVDDNSKIQLFSIPAVILEEPTYANQSACSPDFLIKGITPSDNNYEVTLSEAQLRTFFDYKGDINNAIGNTINILEQEYKIVGIGMYNYTCISFNENYDYGVIKINRDSKEKLDLIKKQKEEMFYHTLEPTRVVIITENEKQAIEDVHKYLLDNGYSYQIDSSYVDRYAVLTSFFDALPSLLLYTTLLGFGVACILFTVVDKMYVFIKAKVSDNNSMTFDYKRNNRILITMVIFNIIIASLSAALYIWPVVESQVITFFIGCLIMYEMIVATILCFTFIKINAKR